MTPRTLLITLLALGLAVVAGGFGPTAGQPKPAGGEPKLVMMASPIGPIDAGIVAALEDAYSKRTGRYGEPLFFPNSDDWRKRHGGSS